MRKHRPGRFIGLPYDFRPLSADRLRRGLWDPHKRRVFLPKAWGWGYGVNLHEIGRRLRLLR